MNKHGVITILIAIVAAIIMITSAPVSEWTDHSAFVNTQFFIGLGTMVVGIVYYEYTKNMD